MAHRPACPTCRRPIEWSEAFPYRPFCSERCRLIDLGAWLTEKRRIPGETAGGLDHGAAQAEQDEPAAPTGSASSAEGWPSLRPPRKN
jgi:endogenous inhibitor of DNA gyrase (YacG/DUF329 family)